jgi:ubiquinone/menaquinone biosynthesis C-methylase UbiE
MSPLLLMLIIVLIALFLYWQLVLAEGAYLGKRIVAFLYDITAKRYNSIKQYSAKSDAEYLGIPLTLAFQGIPSPLILDVATGTSRLPLAVFQQRSFRGKIVALDSARRMLHEATRYLAGYRDRTTWVWHHAVPLPFGDNSFDAVTCLEALEFMPSTRAALREYVRVLKPGGMLLVSNRIANGRWQMPGKTFSQKNFEALIAALGQQDITTQLWQIDYDLVWSLKPEGADHARPVEIMSALHCPACAAKFQREERALHCANGHRFPVGEDGVLELLKR